MTYKLLSYQSSTGPRAGMLVGDKIFDVAEATVQEAHASVLGVLDDWVNVEGLLASLARQPSGEPIALSSAKLLAPVLYPGALFCAGANFSDHMQEMAKIMNLPPEKDPHELGLKPWHFMKTSRGSVVGPSAEVKMPAYSSMLDWEIELVAVIGQACRDVSIANALKYVAGYTIANDLSARDFVKRAQVSDASPFKWDWVSQKCFDGACPLGPWITPASDIADPQNLAMKLWVGDELMQDSHTKNMIFTAAEQISHLSSRVTLHPGDLILTGTPAGVGMARRRFLKPGETVRMWIEGIGETSNRIT